VVRHELARGGMGRILVADDVVLGRTVALKQLLTPDPTLRARFERELALTARLQHPSIVAVHDGGVAASGEPFYVMKLVTGQPLDRVIAAQRTPADRLALLPHALAVTDAIAYAHAQGIVHRDLKPANVLVGDFGETVVIDWGLAKDLRAPEAFAPPASSGQGDALQTALGQVMGTPAYMPREQASGEALDERADIYAIGAMLYHLLTGQLPYAAPDAQAMLAQVIDGPAPSVAARMPELAPDLAAIVDKAMAWQRADRYATAADLATDLRRFLRGQLVGVHTYTAGQLARRWLRRHRTAVAIGGVAVAALAIGGAVSVRRIVAEEARAQQARALAERHRDEAEAGSRDAEQLSTFMLTTMREQLVPIGKQAVLRDVVAQVQRYHAAQPLPVGSAGAAGRARANVSLGDIALAQGDTDEARRAYLVALAQLADVAALQPEGPPLADAAIASIQLATVDATRGDFAAALTEAQRGVEILERRVAARLPSVDEDRIALHRGLDVLAGVVDASGQPAAALEIYQRAQTMLLAALASRPDDAVLRRDLSIGHNKLGDAQLAAGEIAGALDHYRAGEAMLVGLLARDPQNALWLRDLSISRARLGDALLEGDQPNAALVTYREALEVAEQLAQRDPTNLDWQLDLSICLDNVGDALRATGDLAGALKQFQAALPVKMRLVAHDPADAEAQLNLAVGHNRVGDMLLAQADPRGALVAYDAGFALVSALHAATPTRPAAMLDLAKGFARLGNARLALGDVDGAVAAYRDELPLRTTLASADVDDAGRARRSLAVVHQRLGRALVRAGSAGDALAHLRTSLTLTDAAPAGDLTATIAMLTQRLELADVEAQQQQPAAARATLAAGLAVAGRLVAEHPDHQPLADVHRALRRALRKLGNAGREA